MLRISKLDGTDATTLRLEGSLAGVWVVELRKLCETAMAQGETITLDCAGISFSDLEGVALMRELRRQGARLANCSPFLKFQLEEGLAV
jgi:ABC-type transporter Mla MlaB component